MSHYMTALAMRQKGLPPATKILLYWLADHHNAETGKCFPSLNRLTRLCEMSKRSVQNHIDNLIACNLITVEKSFRDDGKQTANNYKLNLEGVQDLHGEGAEFARGRVQNLPPNNLVRDNLGNNNKLFERFYSAYPKKKARGAALKAFDKAIRKIDPEYIIEKAQEFAKFWEGKDKQYCPYPAKWLNQEQWEDELEVERPQKSSDLLNSLMGQDYSNITVIKPFAQISGKDKK